MRFSNGKRKWHTDPDRHTDGCQDIFRQPTIQYYKESNTLAVEITTGVNQRVNST
jgi:hypothetical protein